MKTKHIARGDGCWRALDRLNKSTATASEIGAAVWPKRTGRVCASKGGGDYAAQMLLGRLRRNGLVHTLNGKGSSEWAITSKGRAVLERTAIADSEATTAALKAAREAL